eukprot:m.142372 g.142372  ORF g.142372 m.142372 type:complete len:643 (-) comp16709_c0_seq3:49-1977(-)
MISIFLFLFSSGLSLSLVSDRDGSGTEVRLANQRVDERRLAGLARFLGFGKDALDVLVLREQIALAAVSISDDVVVGKLQRAGHIRLEHGHLLAGNLRPARVVTHQGNDRRLVASERVKLGHAVAQRAIAVDDPDLGIWAGQLGAQGKAAADTKRAKGAGVQPGQRAARPDDVGGRADKVAAISNQNAVVVNKALKRVQQLHRVHVLGHLLAALGFVFTLLLLIALLQGDSPARGGLVLLRGKLLGEADDKAADVAKNRERGVPEHAVVLVQACLVAVDGDDLGLAAQRAAIAEAEVADRAGEDDQVGLGQRLLSLLARLDRAVLAEQASRHAAQEAGDAHGLEGRAQVLGARRRQRGLATEQKHRPLGREDELDGGLDLRSGGARDVQRQRAARLVLKGSGEEAVDVVGEVPVDALLHEAGPLALGDRLLHDGRVRVERVDGELDKDGPRHARLRLIEGLPHHGHNVAHPGDGRAELAERLEERHLVNILQRTAALEQGGSSTAEEDDWRLGHLRVLDGRHRVGQAWAGGHGCDAGHASHARNRVCRKDGRHLMAGVDHADARFLRGDKDGRDVAADKREDELDPVLLQHLCDQLAAVVLAFGVDRAVHAQKLVVGCCSCSNTHGSSSSNKLHCVSLLVWP